MDITPTDKKGKVNITRNKALNEWRQIYNLMNNVRASMKATEDGKKKYNEYGKVISSSPISRKDVDNIIDYILSTLKDITEKQTI